jgi:hypothetical protein
MLRALVLVLLVANGFVFAWSQGWLSPLLQPPGVAEREPERLLQQIEPDRITILRPPAATLAASQAAEGRSDSAPAAARR